MFASSEDEGKGVKQCSVNLSEVSVDDESDPLDAFMTSLPHDDASRLGEHRLVPESKIQDEEEETPEEMMERIMRAKQPGKSRTESARSDDENEIGHPKRTLEGLPPIDHSAIAYPEFRKDFYQEHGAITALSSGEVTELRKSMSVSVTGSFIPKCVCSFAHLNLPETILSVIRFHAFSAPTPIQSQAIPCALSGRDVIGIAMTGSGKTLAYVIPAVVHILGNELTRLPRVTILCPTRELAIQIEQEMYRFVKKSREQFRSIALTGGLSKYEQFQALLKGCDAIVGNPGRVIDLLQMKNALDLSGVTLCILDEADKMYAMNFEVQLRTIIHRIRPDRQLLMFSATMPPRIEKLAREVMADPIRVVVGSIGQASTVIDQNVLIVHSDESKYAWLSTMLPKWLSADEKTLIFVNTKTGGDELMRKLRQILPVGQIGIGWLNGDLEQSERMRVMNDFKSGKRPILVATDVAARGIDVPGVSCVVEFDAAKDFDTHVHRIGRCGRAGNKGSSWTFLSEHQSRLAANIVESIEAIGQQPVGDDLRALAMKYPPFRLAHEESHHRSRKQENGDMKEVESWEPLEKHFKKGRSESLDIT